MPSTSTLSLDNEGSHQPFTADTLGTAPVGELVAAAIKLSEAYDPVTARALLRRFPDIAINEDGRIACTIIAANLAAPRVAALREAGELWSDELDEIACALEAVAIEFPTLLDSGPLMLWLQDAVTERVDFVDSSELARLLAYRSDSLAYAVCESSSIASVPDLATLLLAHRPGVLSALKGRWTSNLAPAAGTLARAYRDRLSGAAEHTGIVCETAGILAMLIAVLAAYVERGELAEFGVADPQSFLPHFTTSEIRHLMHLIDADQPPDGDGRCPRRQCGLEQLLAELVWDSAVLVYPDALLDLYDVALPRLSRNAERFSEHVAAAVYGILTMEPVDPAAAVERALRLTPEALRRAAPCLAHRPSLFADANLRERVQDIDSPVVRYALVLHSPADQIGDHLRWLLANAPEVAVAAIEDRKHDIVEAIEMRDLLPVLKVEDADVRARAQTLLHRWPAKAAPVRSPEPPPEPVRTGSTRGGAHR